MFDQSTKTTIEVFIIANVTQEVYDIEEMLRTRIYSDNYVENER